ncbi:unnamed protein product [Phytomonas sp. EM1]|nr:unnamed protein product [Phytomonas sp. EM1]|eukprot:CCW62979.1 unnamed protein product [Phytomonas sp. isolate EM1]
MSSTLNIIVDASLSSSFDILTSLSTSAQRQRGKQVEVCARRSSDCPVAQAILVWDSNGSVEESMYPSRSGTHRERVPYQGSASEKHLEGVSAISREAARVDVVLLLETKQAVLFLQKAARSVNAWERYLEAICESIAAYIWGQEFPDETSFHSSTCHDATISDAYAGSLNEHVGISSPDSFVGNAQSEDERQLRLHLVVVPRGVASGDVNSLSFPASALPGHHGTPYANTTNGVSGGGGCDISNKDAAELFSSAVIWSAKSRHIRVLGAYTETLGVTLVEGKPSDANDKHVSFSVGLAIGNCTTVATPDQATHIVLALAHTRLKSLSAVAAAQPVKGPKGLHDGSDRGDSPPPQLGKSLGTLSTRQIRPDARYKCEPHDFQKLYASMLAEVGSYSDRKTIALMAAFPTMHHLLSHLHNFVLAKQHQQCISNAFDPEATVMTGFDDDTTTMLGGDPLEASAASFGSELRGLDDSLKSASNGCHDVEAVLSPVYSTNYGESRSWNVLDNAIVDALITDYRQKKEC